MKIDLNIIACCIKENNEDTTIDKSQYLMEEVPCANYFGVDLYAIPVNAERIMDPLFNREEFFVGMIIAVHLGTDSPNVFITKDDERLVNYPILKDLIGDKFILKISPKDIYTDGIHVYGICQCYLVELEEMLLYYPTSLRADAYRAFRFGFIEQDNRAQIYEQEIKPNMQPKCIFPLIKHMQADIVNYYENKVEDAEDKLRDLKEKHDDAFRVLSNLVSCAKNDK